MGRSPIPYALLISPLGAFKTPQILELSGIGNKEILSKHGIECKVNLPGVGETLRMSDIRYSGQSSSLTRVYEEDHIFVPTIAQIYEKFETLDALAEPEILAKHMEL